MKEKIRVLKASSLNLSDEALTVFILSLESLTSRFSIKELHHDDNYLAIRSAAFAVGKANNNTSVAYVDKVVSELLKEAKKMYRKA